MKTKRKSFASRASLIGAVLLTALIGNWRVAASEPSMPPATTAAPTQQRPATDPRAMTLSTIADAQVDNEQDGHLIPAIYAWDPEVRFVYFRHVSKWM